MRASLFRVYVIALVAAIGSVSSCSMIRVVQVTGATATVAGSGPHFSHDTLLRSSVWKSKNKIDMNCGCARGMSRIKVTTKPADVVLGFISAGFVIKQRVEWDCAQRTGTSDIP